MISHFSQVFKLINQLSGERTSNTPIAATALNPTFYIKIADISSLRYIIIVDILHLSKR